MHVFETRLEWLGEEKLVQRAEGRPDLPVSSPPVYGGEAGKWTPEDLLLAAVESCVLLTTLFFVKKNQIGLKAYTSVAKGPMTKGPSGLRFTDISVAITATVATVEDVAKLEQAVHLAEKFCPLSNVVNVPVQVTVASAVG